MNKIGVTVLMSMLAATAVADSAVKTHPVFGKWTWTRKENNCTEVYNFLSDSISNVVSGEEISESRFTISEDPDTNGFYQMTDEVTKDNGKTGCDGIPGGTPIGDKVTDFIFISQSGNEMLICEAGNFSACFGPLRRLTK